MEDSLSSSASALGRALVIALAAAHAASGCSGDFRPPYDGSRGNEFVANPAGGIHLIEEPVTRPDLRPPPAAVLLDAPAEPHARPIARDGECEVWVHPGPFLCEPSCSPGNCVGPDECAPYPAPLLAGDITVSGLAEPLRFTAGEYGYVPDGLRAGGGLFADDAVIVAAAADGEVPGFTLRASGVAPLEIETETLQVDDGVDEVVRWSAAGSGRIQLLLVAGHHGSIYEAVLVCETEDDGELVVPGDLITQFPLRPSDLLQHPSWLARFSRDVIDTEAGPVELFVASRVPVYFNTR